MHFLDNANNYKTIRFQWYNLGFLGEIESMDHKDGWGRFDSRELMHHDHLNSHDFNFFLPEGLAAGPLVNRFGARACLINTGILSSLGLIICACATNVLLFLLGLLFAGISMY